jgi:hypothetical protein
MEIKVIHDVADNQLLCRYNDGDFDGYTVCRYHILRDRTHGFKRPIERKLPKCTLFDVWLSDVGVKCKECISACNAVYKN